MSTAPHKAHDTTTERVLCGAFALSETTTCSRMPTNMPFQAVFMRGGRRPRLHERLSRGMLRCAVCSGIGYPLPKGSP